MTLIDIIKKAEERHGLHNTRFYRIWSNIKSRVGRRKNYLNITLSDEWKNFRNFRDDMYNKYINHVKRYGETQTTIDRIDNNGNYCKDNCRWATFSQQAENRSISRTISINGKSKPTMYWSKKTGIPYKVIIRRLETGWSDRDTVLEPVRQKLKAEETVCDYCGRKFMRSVSIIKKSIRHYCNHSCRGKNRGKIDKLLKSM